MNYFGSSVRVRRWKSGWLALIAGVLAVLAFAIPAEARRHYHHHSHHRHAVTYHAHHRHGGRHAHLRRHGRHHYASYSSSESDGGEMVTPSGVAAIVVDGNSGRTIYALNENQPRHPASVTKVMTLYLLFEQLEKGRLRLDSPLMISSHAASQAPSKLGLPPGDTIEVEDAIKAVVTKSANDVAVAIAENIGGDEASFAEMMTSKARALGMHGTHFANASGLPNSQQITTAHDLAVLGRAIQDRFPRYYRYFSTHSFAYNGALHRNHNHLLGRVEGMDGIKTGYTAASGFNLLTSVRRDGHHIVAVVLGGRTAGARDRLMANLIEDHIDEGSSTRTAKAITEEAPAERVAVAEVQPAPQPEPVIEKASAYAEEEEEAPAPRSQRAQKIAMSAAPIPPAAVPTPPAAIPAARAEDKARPAFVSGVQKRAEAKPERKARGSEQQHAAVDGSTSHAQDKALHRAAVAATTPSSIKRSDPDHTQIAKWDAGRPSHTGWMIQLGATDDATKASELLNRARTQGHALPASAKGFTEKVQKGHETLYRARFAGLEEQSAESACKTLKRSGFSCFATKN
ncbi:MAG: D-alanyl-D-alanine carboxypeptidase [Methylocystis sp.]|jgi:D-alanyl-D-alanine carboxypeptidase